MASESLGILQWVISAQIFSKEELSSLFACDIDILQGLEGKYNWEQASYIGQQLHERIIYLTTIVKSLNGSYNATGIRSWFFRKRVALGGKAPLDFFKAGWPAEEVALEIQELALSIRNPGP